MAADVAPVDEGLIVPQKRRRIDWAAKHAAVAVASGGLAAQSTPAVGSTASVATDGSSTDSGGALVLPQDVDLAAARAADAARPRVAIVTCTRGCPAARLREWLFWHLAHGVSLFFLRWEGPMDAAQRRALQGVKKKGQVVLTSASKGSASSGFQAVMSRQVRFVHKSLKVARERGVDFLLHLDDDELLYPRDGAVSIPDLLRHHIGGKRCVHFENIEAVFPFEQSTDRPYSRSSVVFRKTSQVLYVNGKSAANLSAPGSVFCSGVHSFCAYDRTFKHPAPEFGLHDDGSGCSHPDCRALEPRAVVLHFDSPSFEEWRAKFQVRAGSKLTAEDEEEMSIFPFKRASVRVFRSEKPKPKQQEQVYRKWRCLPGRAVEDLDPDVTGFLVEKRFVHHLTALRGRSLVADVSKPRGRQELANDLFLR